MISIQKAYEKKNCLPPKLIRDWKALIDRTYAIYELRISVRGYLFQEEIDMLVSMKRHLDELYCLWAADQFDEAKERQKLIELKYPLES